MRCHVRKMVLTLMLCASCGDPAGAGDAELPGGQAERAASSNCLMIPTEIVEVGLRSEGLVHRASYEASLDISLERTFLHLACRQVEMPYYKITISEDGQSLHAGVGPRGIIPNLLATYDLALFSENDTTTPLHLGLDRSSTAGKWASFRRTLVRGTYYVTVVPTGFKLLNNAFNFENRISVGYTISFELSPSSSFFDPVACSTLTSRGEGACQDERPACAWKHNAVGGAGECLPFWLCIGPECLPLDPAGCVGVTRTADCMELERAGCLWNDSQLPGRCQERTVP